MDKCPIKPDPVENLHVVKVSETFAVFQFDLTDTAQSYLLEINSTTTPQQRKTFPIQSKNNRENTMQFNVSGLMLGKSSRLILFITFY